MNTRYDFLSTSLFSPKLRNNNKTNCISIFLKCTFLNYCHIKSIFDSGSSFILLIDPSFKYRPKDIAQYSFIFNKVSINLFKYTNLCKFAFNMHAILHIKLCLQDPQTESYAKITRHIQFADYKICKWNYCKK